MERFEKENSNSEALLIFVKFPHPGVVKTRLAKTLGEQKAAEIYKTCSETVLKEILKLPEKISKYVFYSKRLDGFAVSRWAGPGFEYKVQEGDTLGKRLENAFDCIFKTGYRKVIVIASDTPDISSEILSEAFTSLNDRDIVIGPCYDGGYYLIGMKGAHKELFEGIPWSTEKVFEETVNHALNSRLAVHQLRPLRDIDTEMDFYNWLSASQQK